MLKRFLKWLLADIITDIIADELQKSNRIVDESLQKIAKKEKAIDAIFGKMEVSVDVHRQTSSWAVISIAGQKSDYIKFLTLHPKELKYVADFLRNFENRKVDASPNDMEFLELKKYKKYP